MSLLAEPSTVTGKQRQTLGERVKKLRDAAELSQQALAEKARLSVSVISSIEQGRIEDPRASTLRALARALSVKMDDLLAD